MLESVSREKFANSNCLYSLNCDSTYYHRWHKCSGIVVRSRTSDSKVAGLSPTMSPWPLSSNDLEQVIYTHGAHAYFCSKRPIFRSWSRFGVQTLGIVAAVLSAAECLCLLPKQQYQSAEEWALNWVFAWFPYLENLFDLIIVQNGACIIFFMISVIFLTVSWWFCIFG